MKSYIQIRTWYVAKCPVYRFYHRLPFKIKIMHVAHIAQNELITEDVQVLKNEQVTK